MSFAPVAGTEWSFIMTVPTEVFSQRFAPFIAMTVGMLGAMVAVISIMLAVIYRFMRQSIQARAEAVARTEFLSNMSHEIRTPLNGIIGLNHLMERHVDDATAMRDYVNRLGKAAQYLLSLVNDILDMSKLQAGKVDLTSEPFDVNALVDNVCEMQRGPMADRGIRFELSRTVEHPWLRGDEVRLSQVLMNILSNAVKFTPEDGRITMKVHEAVYASGNEAVLTVSIADTGCGMTKEFAEHVFDAFTQERNRNSDSQKGTGLGMSISYLLMTQMGGSITVESEPGCGSCFTVIVTLPPVANGDELTPAQAPSLISSSAEGAEGVGGADRAEKVEAEVAETVEAPGAPGAVRAVSSPSGAEAARAPVEILVAEDNELNADIISSILTEEGFSITVAENGEEAVRLFSESPAGHFAARRVKNLVRRKRGAANGPRPARKNSPAPAARGGREQWQCTRHALRGSALLRAGAFGGCPALRGERQLFRQVARARGGAPLAEQGAPGAEFLKALVQLFLVQLHPGVEQLELDLEGGAAEDHGRHVPGHGLAVQLFEDEGADRAPRGLKVHGVSVHVFGQRQQVGIQLADAGHGLFRHADAQAFRLFRSFRRVPGGSGRVGRQFPDEMEAEPVFEHHGLQGLLHGIAKFFLRFRHVALPALLV